MGESWLQLGVVQVLKQHNRGQKAMQRGTRTGTRGTVMDMDMEGTQKDTMVRTPRTSMRKGMTNSSTVIDACQSRTWNAKMPSADWKMPNAKWQMPNGKSQMANAKCQMGKWQIANGLDARTAA